MDVGPLSEFTLSELFFLEKNQNKEMLLALTSKHAIILHSLSNKDFDKSSRFRRVFFLPPFSILGPSWLEDLQDLLPGCKNHLRHYQPRAESRRSKRDRIRCALASSYRSRVPVSIVLEITGLGLSLLFRDA
jgi:hypothetical protein